MTALWRRGFLDSIVAQAMAALILAIFGAALWAIVLWHMGRADTNRWHDTVRQEISTYKDDGDTDALLERLRDRGVEATYEPEYRPGFEQDSPRQHIRDHLWVRLPTHTPTWAAFEPRGRGVSLWAWAAGMAALAGCLSWMMAWHWVRPLRRLSASADDIVRGKAPPEITTPLELAQLSQALGQAAMAAKTAAEERKLFLAGVSHDLRQPLARVRMAMAIEPLADEELAAGVERDLMEMDSLLSQFIEWVRDGQDEVRIPVDLGQLVLNLSQMIGGPWKVQLPDVGEAIIHAPPLALRRALSNLLHNAGKHGRGEFEATLKRSGKWWLLSISDHGQSSPPENMEALLEPFKGMGPRAGAGLGLAVADRVIEHIGGELRFRKTTAEGGWSVDVLLPTD